jgi:hypothetical protein
MMTDHKPTTAFMTPRRGFFTRVAGVMTLGVAAFVPTAPHADTEADDGPDWPGKLTGRHKQVIDAYTVNDGYPLAFVINFLTPNKSATARFWPCLLPLDSVAINPEIAFLVLRNRKERPTHVKVTRRPFCSGKSPKISFTACRC